MSVTDEFVEANQTYQQAFEGPLPLPPARKAAVVACMDARLDPAKILGIAEGDAHVIRNAGGVVTEDALRSLAISQRLLGTEEIVLVHHTDCGMLTFQDDEFRRGIEAETGIRPSWAAEAFSDLAADVRQGINRIKGQPVRAAHRPGPRVRVRRRHGSHRRGRRRLTRAAVPRSHLSA